jgi:hypothetical protein
VARGCGGRVHKLKGFEQNGFQSWRVAIGDILDAGRWLVAQGIADPSKLTVVYFTARWTAMSAY